VPGAAARWAWVLGSWDRFVLPFPFGRGVQIYGDLLEPPAAVDEASVAAFARTIEDALNRITAEADRACGRVPVEPDPAEPVR